MKKLAMIVAVAMALPAVLWSQSTTTDFGKPQLLITDGDVGYANRTFDKDTVYVLKGYVYFEAPGTLTIQPGTVIKGLFIQGADTVTGKASALIIARDAFINAQGSAIEPIVFTTQYDSVALPDNNVNDGVDYTVDQGLWGGVIICGRTHLNVADSAIVEGLPITDARAYYGGTNDNDSSGVFRYVSIKYSGKVIESNRELQSLTVCCAGSRTVIEYVESFRSSDDGFEFFGGTFNTRYLASIFADDDAFDYDQGFRGNHQFWFAMQASNGGDRCGEFDSGDTGALTNTPLANPLIYNVTFLGRGASATGTSSILTYKEFGGGRMFNSIFSEIPTNNTNAFDVDSGSGARSYNRLVDSVDQLVHQYNIWYKPGAAQFSQFVLQSFEFNYLSNVGNNNTITDPMLTSISRTVGTTLDPRPSVGSPALTLPRKALPADPWWTPASYYGAFSQNTNWLNGWTTLSQLAIVDVQDGNIAYGTPTSFTLGQNYPNPFNPSTTIVFDIAKESKVKLTVYNVIGQEVTTLVNDVRPGGKYKITWNASNLASGVYFYRLEAGGFVMTKKMLLIK